MRSLVLTTLVAASTAARHAEPAALVALGEARSPRFVLYGDGFGTSARFPSDSRWAS